MLQSRLQAPTCGPDISLLPPQARAEAEGLRQQLAQWESEAAREARLQQETNMQLEEALQQLRAFQAAATQLAAERDGAGAEAEQLRAEVSAARAEAQDLKSKVKQAVKKGMQLEKATSELQAELERTRQQQGGAEEAQQQLDELRRALAASEARPEGDGGGCGRSLPPDEPAPFPVLTRQGRAAEAESLREHAAQLEGRLAESQQAAQDLAGQLAELQGKLQAAEAGSGEVGALISALEEAEAAQRRIRADRDQALAEAEDLRRQLDEGRRLGDASSDRVSELEFQLVSAPPAARLLLLLCPCGVPGPTSWGDRTPWCARMQASMQQERDAAQECAQRVSELEANLEVRAELPCILRRALSRC